MEWCNTKGDRMKKCVRITVFNIRDPDHFLESLKKNVDMGGIEGVVEIVMPDVIELSIYGAKEMVDSFINELEGVLITHNIKRRDHATFSVEPFLKEEDYRGVVRFLKKGSHSAAH